MLAAYKDITNRIKEEPKWYDSNGVPRFDKFHPALCPNIYAKEVVLLKISCQHCGREFLVSMDKGIFEKPFYFESIPHYGDPPNHNCIGDTENCNDLKLMEHWQRDRFDWIKNRPIGTKYIKQPKEQP